MVALPIAGGSGPAAGEEEDDDLVQTGALGEAAATTGADGAYEIDHLPQGDFRVLARDGSELISRAGLLHQPTFDDGSVPGLVLVADVHDAATPTLHAIDAKTGKELWTTEGGPVLLVNGRLVTATSASTLRTLDARTGRPLWEQHIDVAADTQLTLVTDGDRILAIEGSGSRLVARSMATGREEWSGPWSGADGTLLYALPSGTVLAVGSQHVTALAP